MPSWRPVPVVVPIQNFRSSETIRVLEELLVDARRGQCIGIVYAAMYLDREYVVDIAGEPRRHETFTLGMVRRLDHELNAFFLKR